MVARWCRLPVQEDRTGREMLRQVLDKYRRDDIDFVPHVGLGLFVKEGARYDWAHPREADLDQERYDGALQQAKTLPLGSTYLVERLHLVKIPDEVLDWTAGQRASIPEDWLSTEIRVFGLGTRSA